MIDTNKHVWYFELQAMEHQEVNIFGNKIKLKLEVK